MTESEVKAIRWIESIKDDTVIVKEEIFDNKAMCCNILPRTIRKEININAEIIIKALSELDKYREIGTVEECLEAMERQRVKKPRKREVGSDKLKRIIYHCPNCDKRLYDCAFKNGELDHVSPGSRKSKRCEKCDCRLDWSDTD